MEEPGQLSQQESLVGFGSFNPDQGTANLVDGVEAGLAALICDDRAQSRHLSSRERHHSGRFVSATGGDAEGAQEGEEDPLELGVELMAQPRGKRLQAVTLMSGGEKALTGLALLFAIFYHRPSPFCVLDEVDAPLDDANIHRFLRVLRELCTQTQFVVITHNRKTMEAADVLYGVTMEEPGLSRLVSVKLTET